MDEITQAHREEAAKAHLAGRVLVLDRGPSEPKPIEKIEGIEPTDEEKTRAHNLKREHAEWHERHKEPIAHRMMSVDANEAVSRDPDRYLVIPRAAAEPVTIEDRMTRVEKHLKLGPYADREDEPEEDRLEVDEIHSDETGATVGAHQPLGPVPGEKIPQPLEQSEDHA